MTPFALAGDSFQFFIGDQECKQEIATTPDTSMTVYGCVTGDNIQNIQNMRFSISSEQDLTQQERLPFTNATMLLLPSELSGKIAIYAQYSYDASTVATIQDTIDIGLFSE
jgi:hypothetical protein